MKLIKSFSIALIAIITHSCGPAVTTMKPTNDNLDKYNTFSYLPNAALEMPDKNSKDGVNRMVIQAINDNMIDAGYRLERDAPDLLVLISSKIAQETEVDREPLYASYGYYNRPGLTVNPYYSNFYYRGYTTFPRVVGYDTDTYNYKEGTLIIQLVDRETNETVWKGLSSKSIYDSANTKAMTNLVNAIFEEYPLLTKK